MVDPTRLRSVCRRGGGRVPGRDVVEPVSAPLTAEEERGIREALEDLDVGRGIPLDDVLNELEDDSRHVTTGAR